MARLLSPAFTREKNQLESTHVITWAFELAIEGVSPFRLVNYDQDLLFHGFAFQKYSISVDGLEDANSMALVRLRATIANVSQDLSALLENYWHPDIPWSVTIWQIDTAQPNETPFGSGDVLAVMQVATDLTTAVVDLQAEGFTLGLTVPKGRYTAASGFPFIPRRF